MAASSSSALVPSSSISSLGSSSKYQVFLSFRGEDTRKGFTGHLYKVLKDAGIHTFMDDEEIEVGGKFGERLLKAIKESRYYVVILSKGYANSKWCLKELTAMVDHMIESAAMSFQHKKAIIPVFYYVEPSDVRHQKGPFEQSFRDYEMLYNPADVEEWRQAMTEVGRLEGLVINDKSNKKERELIEEIVERVGGPLMFPMADHPVGMDSGIEEVMKLLSIEEGGVKIVGIYGMGGVGKTTLAKEIHKRLQGRFDKAIYIEGIKNEVKKDGLPKLQEQFISQAFKDGKLHIYNSSKGIAEIRMRFRHTRLLAILDDVDHRDQLNALAGGRDWFCEGTRILITTRDTHLLNAHGVDKRYEVPQLNSRDSLRLFSWHAFKNEKPSEGYMEISQQIAKAAGGLPLALEVLGSSLIGKNNKRIWEQVVTKLRGLSYDDINGRLRISYDGLDQEEQNIFLDVACFFIDEKKERVIDTLRGCDFKAPESSIDVLLQKCLLKVDDRGKLRMHDLLRNMGRNIGSPTRLWAQPEVWKVLDGRTEKHEIEGIVCQRIPEREEESLDVEAFTKMSNLRLLLLEDIHLKGDFSKMPISLRSLRWKNCSMKVLPDNFNIQKIGFLDLSMGNITQLWSDSYMSKKKVFPNLKLLDLSECKGLVKLPDFSCSLKLEKLYLRNCCKLVSIPDSICLLKNLVYLDISRCRLIKELPNEIGKLEKLIELYLHGTKIDALPHSVRSLQKLEVLYLNGCAELLDFVVNLKSLRELSVGQYMLEKNIPDQSVGKLTNLKKSQVGGELRELPNAISNLTKLCELGLSGSNIELLPESIGFLQNLKVLNLEDCKMLKCLPESIRSLTRLEELNLSHCDTLRVLPSSIGALRELRELVLAYVPIEELPSSIQLLENLTFLDIVCCDKLETVLPLWELKSLLWLRVGSGFEVGGQQVGNLVEMSGKSPHSQECRIIQYVPSTNFEDLWHLSVTVGYQKRVILLEDWNFLGRNNRPWLSLIFPNDFVDLQYKFEDWSPTQGGKFNTGTLNLHCIRVIDLSNSDMEELDESIVHLPNLKQLNLRNCKKLKCLPISFGCLTLLRYLNLWGCESLTALPESIGGMKNLYYLVLGRSGIKELPNTMKSLSSLGYLNMNACVKPRGGLPLCDLEELRRLDLVVADDEEGEETNEEVPDDMVEMSGYSEQLQQFRRIRFIACHDDVGGLDHILLNQWELSIGMGDDQERVIQVWEHVDILSLRKWQWLKLIFPEDFDREQSVAVWPSLIKQLGQCLDPQTDVPVLTLREIDTQSLPDTIGCLSGLRILRLRGECEQLTCLPESIGYLTRLRSLDLRGCTSLLTLPNSIGNLTKLEVLELTACTSLKLLPNSIGNLKRLWSLNLMDSGIEVLPHSFPLLESLELLCIIGCNRLRGRLPLWEMKCLESLFVGGEVDQKVEGDDGIGEKEFCEIPYGITRYSQQAKEYRRIKHSNIQLQDEQRWMKLELSIWVEGSQEREIELFVFPPCEGRKGQLWLRHIFPDDFTPQYDTRTRSEASASHSSPPDTSAATEAIIAEEKPMISLESEPLVSLNTCKKETEVIQEIVERVMLPVAENPVGMDYRVEEVMKMLSIGEGGVKVAGIYGMGGVGKTTLAKEIHNRLQGRFDKAIYIEGIKDKKDRLPELQEELISKVFVDGNKKICNTSEGVAEIKRRFRHKCVLAVLDDVDHRDQLKALAGGCDWFGEGTRILITTRDVQLLDVHGHVAKKYQVHELNSRESLRLFSQHAFNSDQPTEEFTEISKKIVKAAGGLPLALEVLGASLSTETKKEAWEEVETKLRSSGYVEIDKCLRISYDGLSHNEQKAFLDIACFFLGEENDNVIDIWKGCDFDSPMLTVNSLLHKCLVKVDDFGRLHMHDLLRDMGRVIGSCSRLWDQKKVWDVLLKHQGTYGIKGIICKRYLEGEGESFDAVHSLVPPEQEKVSVDVEAFANMSNLQLLLLEDINLKGDFSRMPRSLRSLKWTGCSMQTLPDNFNIQKLGCLKLYSSKIVQFWSGNCMSKKKVFANLKVLDLRDCSALTKVPDFSHSLDLEKLCLRGCSSLTDIPESIGNSTKLKMIDLIDCSALQSLPDSIRRLSELQHLVLRSCSSLSRLPDSIEELTGLRKLEVSSCESLLALPSSIESFTRLEELSLRSWASFSTLPHFVENLTRLRSLDASDCECLSALPDSIENLCELQELRLDFCKSLSTLPNSIGKLTRLKRLMLNFCKSLSALPDSIGNLTELEELVLRECTALPTLPDSIGNLTGLRRLDLSYCESLSALPYSIERLTLLEELRLGSCTSLSTLPHSIGNLMRLRRLHVFKCGCLSALPNSLGRLTALQEVILTECRSLSMLPNSIGYLTWLKSLTLCDCKSLSALPDSIENLIVLRILKVAGCKSLSTLPDSIGNLTGLEELNLTSCKSLSTLPSSIGSMRRLSTLVLSKSGIEELPDSVCMLESLEWLGIVDCRVRSRLPLWELKRLKGLLIGGEFIQKDESDSGNEDQNEICEISDGISDSDDAGRMEVCEIPDGIAGVKGEVNQKDESDSEDGDPMEVCEISNHITKKDKSDSDDGDQNNEVCEIPVGITHYSQHTQEYRRIRYIETWDDPFHGSEAFELSIWAVSGRERKIILLVYPWSWKCQWSLKPIFPDDFTPLHDREKFEACACSSSAPDIIQEQLVSLGFEPQPQWRSQRGAGVGACPRQPKITYSGDRNQIAVTKTTAIGVRWGCPRQAIFQGRFLRSNRLS